MRALDRKLLRDAWHLRGQLAACALVLACGIASFVSLFGTYRSLLASRDAYYAQQNYADVFVHVKRAPLAALETLAAIPGVGQIQPRIAADINLDVPGLAEPARARLISLERGPGLNRLHLRAGRWPEPGRSDEVLASEAFMLAHHLSPGASLKGVIRGKLMALTVVGVALSPEYIYEVGPGMLLPDNRRFGVFWMDHAALAAAFDMEGAFNELSLRLAPGGSEAAVIAALDAALARWGSLGATGREEQVSHRFISDEIAQSRVSASFIPSIFLAVAAFLLHIILSRLMQLQRAEIGLLKAFGYDRGMIGWHLAKFALLVGGAGAALGLGAGLWIARRFMAMYADFYRFPQMLDEGTRTAVLIALLLAAAAALLGALLVARAAVRLPPAEAMRPEPPASFHAGWLERAGVLRSAPPALRMMVRQVARRPLRALAAIAGIAVAGGLIVLGNYFRDAFDRVLDIQFEQTQHEDLAVVFVESRPAAVVADIGGWPGVLEVQAQRAEPARLRAGHRSRLVDLNGLPERHPLHSIVGLDERRVALPATGLLLSAKLAELLAVVPGSEIEVELLEGRRHHARLTVNALVDDALGLNAYLPLAELDRLAGDGEQVTGVLLRVDPRYRAAVYERLKQQPAVAGVVIRAAMLSTFRELLERNVLLFSSINIGFACAIAIGLVYNGARIALSERGNELATLRVLGYTRGEAASLLLGEQGLLTLIGIPVGLGLGAASAGYFSLRLSTELYRLPFTISAATLTLATLVVVAAAVFSGLVVAWRIRRLDLIAVLKTRE